VALTDRAKVARPSATSLGDDLVVVAAEVGEELLVLDEQLVRPGGEAVAGLDVHADEVAVAALGHAGGTADEVLAATGRR
jgi:hypothetical protein